MRSEEEKKAAKKAAYQKWRSKNIEKEKARRKAFRCANLEKDKAYRAAYRTKNKDRLAEYHKKYSKEWRRDHKDLYCALAAKRRAAKKMATPTWANLEEIKAFYIISRFLSDMWGEEHHVDHIVPLQGENMCGLHVQWNLRVLTRRENIQKGNRLEQSGIS